MSNSTITSAALSSSFSSAAAASSSSSVESSISSAIASSVASSIGADSTVTVEPSSTNVVTSIISASSVPPTTNIITSVITASDTSAGSFTNAVTVVITSSSPQTTTATNAAEASSVSAAAASSSSAAALQNNGKNANSSGGLSAAGTTAVAVVVPVVVVALLVVAGLLLWRKRKQRKNAEEQRRKEVEDYGFNPNNDPTLPAIASDTSPEMAEDNTGYRGWGTTTSSHRKASTTLSGGHTQGQLSDPGDYHSPSSPTDGHSGDPLMNRRETMNSDDLGALGAAPLASNNPMRRGISNASSSYSGNARSDGGSEEPVPPIGSAYDYNPATGYGYSQSGPYGDGSYGGGGQSSGMPVVRDVSARRNTRIEQPGSYGQGRSGIAQNF